MYKLPHQSEWTFDILEDVQPEIKRAADSFGLDPYPYQLEIITSDQMLDLYSDVGMPVSYNHWSKGMQRISEERRYKQGHMGLAYEIIINSSPSIAYLMQNNTLAVQVLTIAHAIYGHGTFFKNNYLFREWTDAESIIDYLVFAKNYVAECERKYGIDAVERILDSCHALESHGVDRYKRPSKISMAEEKNRQKERAEYAQSQVNDLWRTIPDNDKSPDKSPDKSFPESPQENILYFIEKHAPNLETWQRELVRIVRKIAQYFYPQKQSQLINEGTATFWHYNILNKLYDNNVVGEGFMMEFLQSHSGVVAQYPGRPINPYALGFAMYQDIRRVSENPTEEDRKWLPHIAGKNWLENVDYAMRNFRDESFISQYLSPKVIRDFHLFSVRDDDMDDMLEISAIHDDDGYQAIRNKMSDQYNLSLREPNIQVTHVDMRGDRTLTLTHTPHNGHSLNEHVEGMMLHLKRLWGLKVVLETQIDGDDYVWEED